MNNLFSPTGRKGNPITKPSYLLGKYSFIVIFCALFFLFFLPYILNGEDTYIQIHDNLDSQISWRVVLTRDVEVENNSGIFVVPQIMGGIPRYDMVSSLNIIMFLYKIFSPFQAYMVNHILVHIIAFVGMYLFSSRYLLDDHNKQFETKMICLGVSFAFSVLPFYTIYGLSVAGQPLLLYSFLNLTNEKAKLSDYFILFIFPFYSFLFMNGAILIIELFLVFLYFLIVKKHFARKALLVILIFSLSYLLIEHEFIYALLFGGNTFSQRSDWNLNYQSNPIHGVVNNILSMFLHGQYHASSQHELILLISFLVLIISIRELRKKPLILYLLLIQLFFAMIYGLYTWDILIPLKSSLGIFSSFNWGRFHWLSPFLWYCIFFLSLMAIFTNPRVKLPVKSILITLLLIMQVSVNLAHNSEIGSYLSRYLSIPYVASEQITYKQFFSENLFARIKDSIYEPQEDYRVASIGIHPAIAQYNGFYTLDGYQYNYPLSYKKQFRKIIAPELEKNKTWQEYFDDWGSRCYLFSSEIPDFLSTKEKNRIIKHLDIDTQAFTQLGGRYIFSAAEILNYHEEGLDLVGVFDDNDSAWRIYVYGIEN